MQAQERKLSTVELFIPLQKSESGNFHSEMFQTNMY